MVIVTATVILHTSCAVSVRKGFRLIERDSLSARLYIPAEADSLFSGSDTYSYILPRAEVSDTLTVIDPEGRRVFFMKTVEDSTGTVHAAEELQGVVVTARFKNIPERKGMIKITFDINVPQQMLNPLWQVRLRPVAVIMGDTLRLEEVRVTGNEYREKQMRGYEIYRRFLEDIISDSTELIHTDLLETFIDRNIPALAALSDDSSAVDTDLIKGLYGISFREVREHYLRHLAIARNDRRKERLPEMYERYAAGLSAGGDVRIDSVISKDSRDITYTYSQSIRSRAGLRRIDLSIDGSIFYDGQERYSLPSSSPLTYYISTFATLAENREKFITVIEDTTRTTVMDTTYHTGLQAIMDRNFQKAVQYLGPYRDFNSALAFLAMDYNASAMQILETLPVSGKRDYLMAIVHSRNGNERRAVECFINSISLDPTLAFRGNLDPEISRLIEKYDILSLM